ncbi:MAG: M14 family metallopeptidase [Deltaproteobacteria bacterium]|nr:M14 family metallopeptidase [Deltaproteobacteria bacterium]
MAQDPKDGIARLGRLDRGFRSRYLDHAELTEQLEAWAEAFPELCHLEVLDRTEEGREIWLLTVGREPGRRRPGVWVDGNMHASELAGSSVALAIAEEALRLHLEPGQLPLGLPEPMRAALEGALFYVCPRMSPDGAEAVLKTGRYVRSVPRDERQQRNAPRWRSQDVDGDGLSFLMRVPDPAGEFVASDEVEGLMLPRRPGDPGPYFRLYPEGVIESFDGHTIPDPHYLADNDPDLNRNFPWSWAPEPEQSGAGAFPTSERESRAVVRFASEHPNLYAWLNLHTFGGVFIRPLGDEPDTKMNPGDTALFRQLEVWAEGLTGYPMVSGFEEFTYDPEQPIRGDLSEWAYRNRGCLAMVCELWDLLERIGVPRPDRYVERYGRLERDHLLELGRWDRQVNQGRTLHPWVAAEHPQLGPVEVGGVDPRVGMWNPPYELLGEVCEKLSAFWMHVASLLPRVEVEALRLHALEEGAHHLELKVANLGYLSTAGLPSSAALPHNEPLLATLECLDPGIRLPPGTPDRIELGQLTGWGRGLHHASEALYSMRSRGSSCRRTLGWTLLGAGKVRVRVGNCRVGFFELEQTIG